MIPLNIFILSIKDNLNYIKKLKIKNKILKLSLKINNKDIPIKIYAIKYYK